MRSTRKLFALLSLSLLGSFLLLGVASAADEDVKARLLRLNDVTGNQTIAGTLSVLLKEPATTKKLVAAAKEILKANKKGEPLNYNAVFILGRAAIGVKDYEASEQFLRLNVDQARDLESPKKTFQSLQTLTLMLMEARKFDEAERVYKEIQEQEFPEEFEIQKDGLRRRMAQVLARQGQIDKAMEFVDKLFKEDQDAGRENPLNYELKAQVQREAGKLEDALGTYNKAIDIILKNRRLPRDLREEFADEMRYRLSGIYVDLKKVDKATEVLKELLDRHPDNSTFANDLGFILADHDLKLDEAEALIRKAIKIDRETRKKNPDLLPEEDRDNAAYLDSLGWVLYKKKQYAEAKKYLEQALEDEEGRHLEIYDHLGDCLLKLDDKKGAIEAWKKGIEVATDSRRDKVRKANVEQKIEKAQK